MWRSAVQLCAGLLIRLGGLAQLARATALQAVGQRFDSVILHDVRQGGMKRRHTSRAGHKIFDTTDRAITHGRLSPCKRVKKVIKGGWRMPRLQEATKDAVSCEKPRGAANRLRSVDV